MHIVVLTREGRAGEQERGLLGRGARVAFLQPPLPCSPSGSLVLCCLGFLASPSDPQLCPDLGGRLWTLWKRKKAVDILWFVRAVGPPWEVESKASFLGVLREGSKPSGETQIDPGG